MMKQRVLFVYPRWRWKQGSVVPRIEQLSQMLAHSHGAAYDVNCVPIARRRFETQHENFVDFAKGAVIISLQNTLRQLGRDRMLRLRDHTAGLCMDHVDSVPPDEDLEIYQVHILASHAGCRRVRTRLARMRASRTSVVHVTHHADLRISQHTIKKKTEFRMGYLGGLKRMVPPPDPNDVDVFTYENQDEFESGMTSLQSYPMHYGVRPRSFNAEVSKPFTKGFTAAAMGANILVNRQADDAEFYLGSDYPYFVDSTKPKAIQAGIEVAKATYAAAEWKSGLEVMQSLRHLSNPRFVLCELTSAIETARAIRDTHGGSYG